MLNSPTLTSCVNYDAPAFIGQCLLENSLKSNIKPNSEIAMSRDYEIKSKSNYSKVSIVNKTYEMHKGALCESFFDISDTTETKDFMTDYVLNMEKSLILVIEDDSDIERVFQSTTCNQNCLKLIISFNSKYNSQQFCGVQQINTKSVKEAVNIAYASVKNGESIMFAHVDNNFDLFEHVDFL